MDISFLWEQKANLIGSIFLGLIIYSYFYIKLDIREKKIDNKIKKTNNIIIKLHDMAEKSEVQTILDAVAGFNNSINNFKESIVSSVRADIKELKTELIDYFDKEISRTNAEVKEVKRDVVLIKNESVNEKILVRQQKNKLAWVISIAVFFSTLILGIAQHFLFKIID